MKGTVIFFARAPRFGVGKRRLAAQIGRLAASRFYRSVLLTLLRRLSRGPWRTTVAVAAPGDAIHPAFAGRSVTVQRGRDLGARMAHALRTAPPGPVLVIGTDIPGIERRHLERAFRKLGRADAVFGPAPDGGYWLVGLTRRRPVPAGFMRAVRWSSAHALSDTIATLPQFYRVEMLETLEDVDDAESYRRWKERE